MFDLKTNKMRWESNLGKGICSIEFDRKDIEMNKLLVTCLEAQFFLFTI